MVITKTKLLRVPLALHMDEAKIADMINKTRVSRNAIFDVSERELQYHMDDVERVFFMLQSNEETRIDIIKNMPKKKNRQYEIGRVFKIKVFDGLYHKDHEYNTISKLQFYAKAIDNNNAILELGIRKE